MSDETNPEDAKNQSGPDPVEQQREMTPEELAEYKKMRAAADKELKEEIKFLKTEHEYQRIICEIEEYKTRRFIAYAKQSQFMQPPPGAEPPANPGDGEQGPTPPPPPQRPEGGPEKPERTLTPD